MKKPTPSQIEAPFTIDELFFSTTDPRGVIKFSNDVFIRISGYPWSKMEGSPHSIVRHPDMPKSVFKLFWDFLKSDRTICAYVKNLSADGSFYWVFATAFPIDDGYLSIRFKPSSKFFAKVQSLYSEVLRVEASKGVEAGGEFLLRELQNEGFSSYEDFMVNAAIEELKSRESALQSVTSIVDKEFSTDTQIKNITKSTSLELNQNFTRIDALRESNKKFEGAVNSLKQRFGELHLLTINMQVAAEKFGDRAISLSVVSSQFSSVANEAQERIAKFVSVSNELTKAVEKATLEVLSLKIQILMVDFFVRKAVETDSFSEMISNKESFIKLYSLSIDKLQESLKQSQHDLVKITREISEVQKLTNGLEVVRQVGTIEAVRNYEVQMAFEYYLKGMKEFIDLLKSSLNVFQKEKDVLTASSKEINCSTVTVARNVSAIFDLAMKMSGKEVKKAG